MTTDHPGKCSTRYSSIRVGRVDLVGLKLAARPLAALSLVAALAAVSGASAAFVACGPPGGAESRGVLTPEQSQNEGCTLFVRKCSRCHEIQKIAAYRVDSPGNWVTLVDRMRRLQGSQIKPHQGDLITACLVERQFGREGLEELGITPSGKPGGDDPGDSQGDGESGDGESGDGSDSDGSDSDDGQDGDGSDGDGSDGDGSDGDGDGDPEDR